MRSIEVYAGSDGELTKRFYALLEARGPFGGLAVNLFRAQKCSSRAKAYRGGIRGRGSYRGMAYDRKNWAVENLCAILQQYGNQIVECWGWNEDPRQEYHRWVLYVDLIEFGQVSFHSASRLQGPDYAGEWDQTHKSAERICAFCDRVLQLSQDESGSLFDDRATSAVV